MATNHNPIAMHERLLTLCFILIAIGGVAQSNENLEKFTKVVVRGGGTVQISRENAYTFTVDTHGRCAELVNFSVSSETLYIQVEDADANDCALTMHVGVPSLDGLALNGGGNIVVRDGFPSEDSFECKLRGGGSVDVSELRVDSIIASINGGGTMLLTAEKQLTANISGGGVIEYSGNPKVSRAISGGGSVRRR